MPTASGTPNEFTRTWAGEYDRLDARLAVLERTVSAAQANWKPSAKRWSIAECLEHLSVTLAVYAPRMEAALSEARARVRSHARSGAPPFAAGPLGGRFILRALRGGPGRMKVPAPKIFLPRTSTLVWSTVVREQRERTAALRALLVRSDDLDLGRIRMASPAARLIRLSLAQVFEIHALHGHRHVDQAERVRSEAGFPGS